MHNSSFAQKTLIKNLNKGDRFRCIKTNQMGVVIKPDQFIAFIAWDSESYPNYKWSRINNLTEVEMLPPTKIVQDFVH